MRKIKIFAIGFLSGLAISAIVVGVLFLDVKEKRIFNKRLRELLGIEDVWLVKFRWPDFGREKILRMMRALEKSQISGERLCELLGMQSSVSYEVLPKGFEQIPKSLRQKMKPLNIEDKNVEAMLVRTSFLELWTVRLKPANEQSSKKVCIIQHGHGANPFFEKADELINALLEKKVEIYLPLQPYMDAAFSEYQIWSMGIAMGKQLMSLRVESTIALIDYIKKTHNDPEIIFIGHSGGSMLGLYASICADELDKLAIDYSTDVGQTTFKTLPHCELVYGLGLFGFSEKDEFYKDLLSVSQAKEVKRFEYGYPEIASLLRFVNE